MRQQGPDHSFLKLCVGEKKQVVRHMTYYVCGIT